MDDKWDAPLGGHVEVIDYGLYIDGELLSEKGTENE